MVTLPSNHPIVTQDGSPIIKLLIHTTFTPTIPDPPVISSVQPGNGQVTINWSSSPGAVKYDLFYADHAGVDGGDTRMTDVNSGVIVSGLANGTPYYFALTAIDQDNVTSELSSEVTATPTS